MTYPLGVAPAALTLSNRFSDFPKDCSFSFWVMYLCPYEAAAFNELEHSKGNKT